MKCFRDTITVQTGQGQEFIDVTKRVRDVVARSEIRHGMLVVSSLHTTMALFMNEFQSALIHDLGSRGRQLEVGAYRMVVGGVHDHSGRIGLAERGGGAVVRAVVVDIEPSQDQVEAIVNHASSPGRRRAGSRRAPVRAMTGWRRSCAR